MQARADLELDSLNEHGYKQTTCRYLVGSSFALMAKGEAPTWMYLPRVPNKNRLGG